MDKKVESLHDNVETVALYLGQYKLGHCPTDSNEAICDDLKCDCAACFARSIIAFLIPHGETDRASK